MFTLPEPSQQIAFSMALSQARQSFLQDALAAAVEACDVVAIDGELAELAPRGMLGALARRGLRGELLFAVPSLLRFNPRLLAYYRLLLGFSQKEFFTKATGASAFRSAEVLGRISEKSNGQIDELCRAINAAAARLAEGIGPERLTRELLDDLSLLTIGPQFRGRANVRKGDSAIVQVFDIIHAIVKKAATTTSASRIEIRNAARRTVLIEFAPDPDIIIREKMKGGEFRNIIAIEIKGGTDFSNVHNRLGEAEKSHRKARARGYTECWTVVNVDGLDRAMAHKESPSSDRFYRLSALLAAGGAEFRDFRDRILSLTAIRG